MTLEDVVLLLSLLGGSIYATISITIKVLDFLQKKKEQRDQTLLHSRLHCKHVTTKEKGVVIFITTPFLVHQAIANPNPRPGRSPPV